MERLLERLDGAASTLVPLLYLAGLMAGVAAYFAGVTLDMGLAVGVALAVAAELHSFLQQRRLRASVARLLRTPEDAPDYETLRRQTWVNGGVLAALLVFSGYNAIAFAAATWRPSPGFLPPAVQIAIRGLIIPALFFASGFLMPLHVDAGDQLAATSADMLARTLKAIGKQWRKRLEAAQRRHADLAPIAVALLSDVGDTDGARRVQLIAAGLRQTERAGADVALALPSGVDASHHIEATGEPLTASLHGQEASLRGGSDAVDLPPRPPTGPGSPAVASKPPRQAAGGGNVTPLRQGVGRPPRRDKRQAARANARGGRRGTAEARVRAALAHDPDMTHEALVKVARVSSSTASKYLRLWEQERASEQRQAAQ